MLRLRVVEAAPADRPAVASGGGNMKVAFATQDMKTLDAHFAGARNFAIYDVSPDGWRFLEAVRFDETTRQDGVHGEDGHDRLSTRIDAIDACTLLFVLAIGGPAAARVVARRIHPVKLPKPEPIGDVCDRLVTMLNGTPPPWLRKALQGNQAPSMAFADEDDDR
jgi:nitrogen fixation protein NifX